MGPRRQPPQLYRQTDITPEQVALAQAALLERQREQLAARDLALAHLGRERDGIERAGPEAADLAHAFVDKALASPRGLDRTPGLLATADAITDADLAQRRTLLRLAAGRIHATFAVPHDPRLAAPRFLFAKVATID